MEFEKLSQEILSLTDEVKEKIVWELLYSLDHFREFVFKDDWNSEIEKRIKEVLEGNVKAKSINEVFSQLDWDRQ